MAYIAISHGVVVGYPCFFQNRLAPCSHIVKRLKFQALRSLLGKKGVCRDKRSALHAWTMLSVIQTSNIWTVGDIWWHYFNQPHQLRPDGWLWLGTPAVRQAVSFLKDQLILYSILLHHLHLRLEGCAIHSPNRQGNWQSRTLWI